MNELGIKGEDEPRDEDDQRLISELPTIDASDPQLARNQREAALRRERETIMFWTRCLQSAVGRRVLWDLISRDCHAFEPTFGVGPNGFPQAEASWFHAGEQSVGQRLYRTLLRYDTAGVLLMHQEHDPEVQSVDKKMRRKPKGASLQ